MLEKAFVVGVDYQHGDVGLRSELSLHEDELVQSLSSEVEEVMVLSTCNRFEVYGVLKEGERAEDAQALLSHFLESKMSVGSDSALYCKGGEDMLRHGFRVASSLESMVLGEPQILGQMRKAYTKAQEKGSIQGFMDRFCSSALKVGKRVRHETAMSECRVSIASLAVDKAQKELGSLVDKNVLLLGAGDMGIAAGRHLKEIGVGGLGVVSRGTPRGLRLASELDASVWEAAHLQKALRWADVVVCSTSDQGYVLTQGLVAPILQGRGRPLVLLDIAVPRDVVPSLSGFENVRLYGIDELAELAEHGKRLRAGQASQAEKIVSQEVDDFIGWDEGRKKLHMIKQMRAHFENVRDDVLDKYTSDEAQLATRLLMNKLLHAPMMAINSDKFPAMCMEHILNEMFDVSCPRNHTAGEEQECPQGLNGGKNGSSTKAKTVGSSS